AARASRPAGHLAGCRERAPRRRRPSPSRRIGHRRVPGRRGIHDGTGARPGAGDHAGAVQRPGMSSADAGRAVRVKICGVTTVDDAHAAVAAGADMIGLNLYPGSKRHVTLARAREIATVLPAGVWKVGIFVNAGRDEIERARAELALDAIQ